MRIAVFNGPNLNLLGIREPEIYGTTTLGEIETRLEQIGAELGITLLFSQFNDEGRMLDAIHNCYGVVTGALVNAGAWTHTSLAIRDAFTAVQLPYVEVHLSNIYAREPERRHSWLAPGAIGIVAGFGADGYELALRGLVTALRRHGADA
ncbi:MAG: type II 3-dehydroquinate dehydratase [Gemmatimonadota bacterium]|jgi:3-dehydroquinate dehydratase-2|nr:type II 3-dehydroquinate dehydratase [Gemmatimonadota bacterium]MDQ8146720.1 type II 3-dehydroquinate dehydratase [Gemmatimonadota bacterium]MDQ8149137.1 type II 3-dehydroquinate dehydratase [Gemmatimonadota bacterium]MDQ8156817.1 type II 3-dehydroquinate dehydratase [Gemmatimonadota bacterium]MDQ8176073.1 type II 3-dehydroquinate dehydratase [Gemmatimonadota bacterium]